MKISDKLIEAFERFRPHVNGHISAINIFLEAVEEVKEMENELSKLHQPTVSESVCICKTCGKKFKNGLSENLHNMEEH
jgi:hypothetical protein